MGEGEANLWVGQGHREWTQYPCQGRAESLRKDSKMQRKRTGPGAPGAGPSPRKREPVDLLGDNSKKKKKKKDA